MKRINRLSVFYVVCATFIGLGVMLFFASYGIEDNDISLWMKIGGIVIGIVFGWAMVNTWLNYDT